VGITLLTGGKRPDRLRLVVVHGAPEVQRALARAGFVSTSRDLTGPGHDECASCGPGVEIAWSDAGRYGWDRELSSIIAAETLGFYL